MIIQCVLSTFLAKNDLRRFVCVISSLHGDEFFLKTLIQPLSTNGEQ